uniref:Uncharacterized protein n=1 Tax=Nelumbo nucifera TaxID=4432 RepID=A0A822YIM8_NELNU|nr:TPA_asm: hypothetical protein HUJ06_004694 [Nelumbo nucifera]
MRAHIMWRVHLLPSTVATPPEEPLPRSHLIPSVIFPLPLSLHPRMAIESKIKKKTKRQESEETKLQFTMQPRLFSSSLLFLLIVKENTPPLSLLKT